MSEELEPRPWRAGSRPMDNEEKEMVLHMYADDKISIAEIARRTGRKHETISRFLRSMSPTAYLAQGFLRANALTLAKRIVEKSTVSEAIDVLSRPNIGALKPLQRGSDAPSIMISVNTDSIGAVVMPGASALPIAPLSPASRPLTLVGSGATDGAQDDSRPASNDSNGDASVQGGDSLSAEAGRGLRSAPAGASAPEGPPRVEPNRGDVSPGRQGRVKRHAQVPLEVLAVRMTQAQKDKTRPAIINRARPNSSINLNYEIEQDGDDE